MRIVHYFSYRSYGDKIISIEDLQLRNPPSVVPLLRRHVSGNEYVRVACIFAFVCFYALPET